MTLKNIIDRYRIVPVFTLTLAVLLSTTLFWLPFLLRFTHWLGLTIPNSNFLYIYKNYDGPLYVVAAKTFYDPRAISKFPLDIGFDPKYFAAHLPLYPLFIRLFAPVFNFSRSAIFVNIFFTLALCLLFYFMTVRLKLTGKPLILAIIFLMLPRFLIVRSIGAPESLFIFLVLLSLFFFEKNNYPLAGIFGGLATMTKTPGILLLLVYLCAILEKHFGANKKETTLNWKMLFILLIPAALFSVFYLYQIQYHDFYAYFHSGDNIHLAYPFAVFNSLSRWVGNAWLEDVLFYFFIYLLAVLSLRKIRQRSFFYFALIFYLATIFVQHRDISRYSLPLWPMAAIAFERFLTSRKFIAAMVLLLPAIYLYAWNFSLQNYMPVTDWSGFFSR